ncbi:ankyrin repeat domain-containing protein 27 isoform X2 [Engraulis encrasicolus]|uniref:ankyrin repeat domain-containing protein 27 isoform X2 n=1 Tax=Engraulis encrasicolus TaxID=184585 RepID=UPI002FCFE1C5
MAVYDENLLRNPFYQALEKQRPDLCSRVAEVHGIILVPCQGSLPASAYTAAQFEKYVLLPSEQGYQTADGKDVSIQDNQVRLGAGFPCPGSVPILFEETFYNEKEQAYSLLCVARPLEAQHNSVETAVVSTQYCFKNVDDVKLFLGRHTERLDKIIVNFNNGFKEQERKGLRYQIDSVNALYTKCLQNLLRDTRLKVLAKQVLQMTLLKQSVEMYVHHGIHEFIFNYVGSLEASQDAAFNKTTRGLQDVQQKDLGIKSEFSINILRAKRELSQLNRCTSPLHKLLCLRKVALTIMQSPSPKVSLDAICADDLLSVILYLLVKTEIPNWMANLSYIKNFHFSNSTKDDLSYCLTSFEAAVQYISQGNLTEGLTGPGDLNSKLFFSQKMNLLSQSAATPIDHLFEHIANGNEGEVRRLLSESEKEEDGDKLCHPLCSCDRCEFRLSGRLNDPSIITSLSRDDRGYTPLHVAAFCGQSSLIDLLVSKGAVVNATDYHALTPLHLSCQKGYQGVTLLLLHYKANTDAQDNNGNTPLHLACMHGHEDCVKAMVYFDLHSCRLNIQNDKGDTPLHIAARWGYEGIIGVLLENGASTAIHNKAKDTPLQCALNSKILSQLERIHNGSPRKDGSTDSPGRSPPPSECSSRRSSVSSSSSLNAETRADPDKPRHREVEKLLRAIADGDVEMVRYLLEWVDEEPEEDVPAVPTQTELCHPLCQCPQCEPTQKLVSAPTSGVGVNSSSADGFTPLHVAALHGHLTLVTLLTRHGATVNARNSQGATPLHLACQNSHLQVTMSLLECNAKVNKKDQYGNTPLITACLKGHLDTATALLKSSASVNLANNHGNTALHEAVRGGHAGLVELLMGEGALVHMRNKRQRTPLDCAQETGGKNTEIVKLLQRAPTPALEAAVEPDRLPKGTLAQSLVDRLKQQEDVNNKRQDLVQSFQRTQQAVLQDKTRSTINSPLLNQMPERKKLQRGETVETSSPKDTGGERGRSPAAPIRSTLTRSHTVHQALSKGTRLPRIIPRMPLSKAARSPSPGDPLSTSPRREPPLRTSPRREPPLLSSPQREPLRTSSPRRDPLRTSSPRRFSPSRRGDRQTPSPSPHDRQTPSPHDRQTPSPRGRQTPSPRALSPSPRALSPSPRTLSPSPSPGPLDRISPSPRDRLGSGSSPRDRLSSSPRDRLGSSSSPRERLTPSPRDRLGSSPHDRLSSPSRRDRLGSSPRSRLSSSPRDSRLSLSPPPLSVHSAPAPDALQPAQVNGGRGRGRGRSRSKSKSLADDEEEEEELKPRTNGTAEMEMEVGFVV